MHFSQPQNHNQLPLFGAFTTSSVPIILKRQLTTEQSLFSEIRLRGAIDHCLVLLAPVLRELSEKEDERWLTLIAPPTALTQTWLRDAGLNRERILLLHPRHPQNTLQLTQEALKLGRSHTVISWLPPQRPEARLLLEKAAHLGKAQSLNISL
jgi:cell division inhibitor SulA